LRTFVEHCYRSSRHYRWLFDSNGLRPSDIRSLEDVDRIPITPKEALRAHTQDFYTRTDRGRLVEVHTSGTTGSPLTVYFSRDDIGARFAFLERCRRWAGVRIGQRRASFTGQGIIPARQSEPPFWRHNRPGNQLLFSSYHLAPEHLPAYAAALVNFSPEIIDGYPSSLHIVGEHLIRSGQAGRITPRAILVSAETLLPHQRYAIETAFQSKVFNQYASSEGAPFISECINGRLHVHLDSGLIEIVRSDGTPASPGEPGEMVVSSFTSSVTPLLRYAIRDVAVAAEDSAACECGLPFPFIQNLLGRVDDILHTPERGYVGRLDTVFKKLPNSVVEAQIVQTTPRRVVVRLVPDRKRYRADHARLLLAELRLRLGEGIDIQIEEVERIEPSANGKMRAVVNLCRERLPRSFQYSELNNGLSN
jgi:phenylacetate-CoA ligase